jgi:hypothetical protein
LTSVRVGVAAILGEGVGMHFDADYREQVTLRDGRVVVLRLVRPRGQGAIAQRLRAVVAGEPLTGGSSR